MNEIRREKVPANAIPEGKQRQFRYRVEELSGKYSDRNLMLLELGVATGYRLQDIVRLTVGEIKDSLENGELEIQEQKQYKAWKRYISKNPSSNRKSPKKRRVSINTVLRKRLSVYCKNKAKSSYAFESNKGSGHITAKAYSEFLSKVGASLGLDNISGHSLRKTFARNIWEVTRSLEKVRLALNHKSIETTKVYLGLDEEDRSESFRIADDKLRNFF